MRYYESREQSAELLRMVLPLMSRHSAGFHPLSYAVWYEYVAGTNHALKSEVDKRIAGGRLLNEEDIKQLFDAFVVVRDIDSSMRIRGAIQKVVEQVNNAAAQAHTEVSEYNRGLSRYQEQLGDRLEQAAISQVVASLRDDTTRIQARTGDLGQQLARSSEEVARISVDLDQARGEAYFDPLTGLLNQRGFERQIRQHDAGGLQGCSLVLASIDNIEQLVELHGRLLGDRIIAAVARVARGSFEPAATPARIAGHEFAALLHATAADAANLLAEKLRATVERGRVRRQDRDEAIGGVTVSVGVASYVAGEGWESLLGRARHALERALGSGGNRVVYAAGEPG